MGFFTNTVSAVVKTAAIPVVIVVDTVDILNGNEAEETETVLGEALDDASDAIDDLFGGNLF